MEFGLSQEQEFLRDTLTRFLSDNAGLARARRFADGGERRAQDLWDGLSRTRRAGSRHSAKRTAASD